MDNLSTVDKIAGPNVSFIKRFHCIYIYIIRDPTRNPNNEFILLFILRKKKMADFECGPLKIG